MPKQHYIFEIHSVMFELNSLPLTSDGTQRDSDSARLTG